jgi:peptidoglycan/xylan/chitin deacetylase (PgdA/CDA1 family)
VIFFSNKFLLIFILSINLYANTKFYTISVCSDIKYESSLNCKDNILKEHKFDIIITKTSNTMYRTNYGVFSSLDEAKIEMNNLNISIKKFKPFLLQIDKNNTNFEIYEVYSKEKTVAQEESKELKNEIKIDETKNSFIEKNVVTSDTLNSEKIAYLTFDDGPIAATENILKIAREEDIPVTLFFIGYQIKNNEKIYENSLSHSNVTILNHTYSHANGKYQKFYSDSNLVVSDINKAQNLLNMTKQEILNDSIPLRFAGRNVFRLPDIYKNDAGLAKDQTKRELLSYDKVFQEGYNIYGWDIEWKFDQTGKPIQTPEEIFTHMESAHKKNKSNKKNKVILLTHDIMFSNHFNGKENLKRLVQLLKNSGWSFKSINNY